MIFVGSRHQRKLKISPGINTKKWGNVDVTMLSNTHFFLCDILAWTFRLNLAIRQNKLNRTFTRVQDM